MRFPLRRANTQPLAGSISHETAFYLPMHARGLIERDKPAFTRLRVLGFKHNETLVQIHPIPLQAKQFLLPASRVQSKPDEVRQVRGHPRFTE
jgi:hypothetical protein